MKLQTTAAVSVRLTDRELRIIEKSSSNMSVSKAIDKMVTDFLDSEPELSRDHVTTKATSVLLSMPTMIRLNEASEKSGLSFGRIIRKAIEYQQDRAP